MTPEQKINEFEGSVRTLGIMHARYLASLGLVRLAQEGRVDRDRVKLHYEETGLLSNEEIDASLMAGMILPDPYPVLGFTDKYVSPDLFSIKVDQEIRDSNKRVYVITGMFDVFTGAHWQTAHFADVLATINEIDNDAARELANIHFLHTQNEHWSYLYNMLLENRRNGELLKEGVVVARLESDDYKREFKGGEPIFPSRYRLGWFEQLPVKWVTMFPTSAYASKSWELGNQLLTGWPEDIDMKNSLVFVLPIVTNEMSEKEVRALNTREEQIRNYGFGVVQVPSFVNDISSSKLIDKFSLKPVDGLDY